MVESPPADAGDAGSCPSLGGSRVPRSGWAREPWPLSLCVQSLCTATGEATVVRGLRTAKKEKVKMVNLTLCIFYTGCVDGTPKPASHLGSVPTKPPAGPRCSRGPASAVLAALLTGSAFPPSDTEVKGEQL